MSGDCQQYPCKRSSQHFLGRKIRGHHEKSYFYLNIYDTYFCENKCPISIHKLECAKRNLIFKTHIPRSQILVCRCDIWSGVWSCSFSQVPQVILKVGACFLRETLHKAGELGWGLQTSPLCKVDTRWKIYTIKKKKSNTGSTPFWNIFHVFNLVA